MKLELVLIFFVMFLVINVFLFSAVVVSTSMNPHYYEGERAIMLKDNQFNQPKHGDVLVINHVTNEKEHKRFFKRVIALPGDTFEIKDNEIYINGGLINDKYRADNTKMSDYPKIFLAKDEFFALGDNRNVSLDSRKLGPFKISDIKAVGGFTYWPLDALGIMK